MKNPWIPLDKRSSKKPRISCPAEPVVRPVTIVVASEEMVMSRCAWRSAFGSILVVTIVVTMEFASVPLAPPLEKSPSAFPVAFALLLLIASELIVMSLPLSSLAALPTVVVTVTLVSVLASAPARIPTSSEPEEPRDWALAASLVNGAVLNWAERLRLLPVWMSERSPILAVTVGDALAMAFDELAAKPAPTLVPTASAFAWILESAFMSRLPLMSTTT